ncbi:MAG: regulatory particle non-ATPase [Thelocarpon superellum]|nr:MAG: regulatory particle non-ATPase [Thelocarpon superellum]
MSASSSKSATASSRDGGDRADRGNGIRRASARSTYLRWYRRIVWTFLRRVSATLQYRSFIYTRQLDPSPSHTLRQLTMAEKELSATLRQIHQTLTTRDYQQSLSLLTRAKLLLLALNALVPSPALPESSLLLARETFELGALVSIRRQDYDSFTRYFEQLQPFYDLPPSELSPQNSKQSKIVGLHLLLLLSQGDYAGFHTVLESLEVAAAAAGDGRKGPKGGKAVEDDPYIQYPVKLEQDLMEGAYDKVWGATKSERVPSEEYGVFSEVLIGTIRSEIATCSEKAYPSLPISNAKNLLFLDSEGSVIEFAESRGWLIRDGRIYFPLQQEQGVGAEKEILVTSGQVIENTIGYARELETIV